MISKVYAGIVLQLVALATFTYFVVLNPSIYLIVILVLLIVWWMYSVASSVLGTLVREEFAIVKRSRTQTSPA